MARPQFVERTVVRRCPGASGCEAAPMMSFRLRCTSGSCSSRAAGCGLPGCCAVLSERLVNHDVRGYAGPTTFYLGTVFLRPLFRCTTGTYASTTHATRRSTRSSSPIRHVELTFHIGEPSYDARDLLCSRRYLIPCRHAALR